MYKNHTSKKAPKGCFLYYHIIVNHCDVVYYFIGAPPMCLVVPYCLNHHQWHTTVTPTLDLKKKVFVL